MSYEVLAAKNGAKDTSSAAIKSLIRKSGLHNRAELEICQPHGKLSRNIREA
jgi:hypothetical protein